MSAARSAPAKVAARGGGIRWRKLAAGFDRINRVLIPKTRVERERFRASRSARAVRKIAAMSERLSPDGQALSLLLLVSALAAVDVLRSQVYVAWAMLAALLGASLFISVFVRTTGVRVEVEAPRRVTLGEEACLSVKVSNDGPRAHGSLRVRGALLPWDGTWTTRGAGLARLEAGASERVELRVRFLARGAHTLEPIAVRALAPLGLALGPAVKSARCRVLVVPRVARVAAIALPQTRRHHRGGVPRASHTADAPELTGVRPYRIGDAVRDLHARTWARTGEPAVREYREEYFTRIGVVLDTDLGGATEAQLEAAVSLVAGIVARVVGTEALLDLMVLGRAVHGATVGRSLGTLDVALDALAAAEAEGPFDPAALDAAVAPHLARLSALVFVGTRWDAARRAFLARVEDAGTACVAYIVAPGVDEAAVRHLDAATILGRGELRL